MHIEAVDPNPTAAWPGSGIRVNLYIHILIVRPYKVRCHFPGIGPGPLPLRSQQINDHIAQ